MRSRLGVLLQIDKCEMQTSREQRDPAQLETSASLHESDQGKLDRWKQPTVEDDI